ncbi:hypothetical protein COB64_00350 [Candidatus Wolfebacteria bacterium]|nr:MAG: hypothetical protein COB64_00350 [Candidatus Wolfebacteria bacterium]
MKEKIWCIIRPNLENGEILNIGIMGTGFFVSENKFVTAHHLLNESVFVKNKLYNNDYIILQNILGNRIKIDLHNNINYYPDKDLTSIVFDEKFEYFEMEENVNKNEEVKNLGFPSAHIKDLFSIKNNKFNINKVVEQNGNILEVINNFSSRSNDVNIEKKKVIVTNYASFIGFSGGPLLNKKGKAIGMMSMLVPKGNDNLSGKVLAISICEIV